MKTGIIIAMAALGLAIFAVPDTPAEARGGWHHGPDVNQRLSGSTFTLSVDGETGNTTAMQNLLAKGQPGSAHIQGLLDFEPVVGPDARCPAEFPLGSTLVSFEFVETFNDGSLLTGAASMGQAVCSDGVAFVADIVGIITGGTGRFDGAEGSWEATALTPGNNGITGTLRADLN
ncbi:MAG: hypothetical protein WBN10_12185 [Polyangiales bacterium]